MDTRYKVAVTGFLAVTVLLTNFFMGLVMQAKDHNSPYKDEDDYKYFLINVVMWHAVAITCLAVAGVWVVAYYDKSFADCFTMLMAMASSTDKLTLLAFSITLSLLFGIGMYIIEGKYIDALAFELSFPFSTFGKLKLRRIPKSHSFTRKMIEAFNLFALLIFSVVLFFYTF